MGSLNINIVFRAEYKFFVSSKREKAKHKLYVFTFGQVLLELIKIQIKVKDWQLKPTMSTATKLQ